MSMDNLKMHPVRSLYEIAAGLRLVYESLDQDDHDAVGPLRLMFERLEDCAEYFDEVVPNDWEAALRKKRRDC